MKKNKILIHNMTFRGIHVVPGVINYDQRGILFAEENDIIITNQPFDKDYLSYLEQLNYPIKKINFFSPKNNYTPSWKSIYQSKSVKEYLKSLKSKDGYYIDVYVPTKYDGLLSKSLKIDHCNNYKLSEKYGTKSGFRKFASAANLPQAEGFDNIKDINSIKDCLNKLFLKGYQKAVIKVDDGISGYGNVIINRNDFPKISSLSNHRIFETYLKKIRWRIVRKGVVEGWIENVKNSASILIQILNNHHEIVCLQDQLLVDGDKWAGCYYPSSLENQKSLLSKLNSIVSKSAKYLIKGGFWGFYSFDVLVTNRNKLYLAEANMRKIGSFYPRVFVNRVFEKTGFKNKKISYVASDYTNQTRWKGKKFNDIYRKLSKYLWPIHGKNEGVLLYNVGAINVGGRFDFVTLSESLTKSKRLRQKVIKLLN